MRGIQENMWLWVALGSLVGAPGATADGNGLAPGGYVLHIEVIGPRQVPILGDLDTRTDTWAWVRLVQEGDALVAHQTACAIVSDGGLFIGRASPALIRGLAPSVWEVLVGDGGPAASVRADLGAYPVGFVGSVLPEDEDDPQVRDPDQNGRPGAAMEIDVWGIGTLKLEVASAWSTQLAGRIIAKDVVAGRVTATNAERVLSGLPFPGELGKLRVDVQRSRFTLKRLPDSATGCRDVLQVMPENRR